MNSEKYCLTWYAYSDHLKDMMKEMMNDDFTDVTLVTEDKKHIKAHKNILSACSPVFKEIVKIDKNGKQIIYLKGINFSELESIIQFIYLGEATFYEERMNEFLDVARSLEIKELCNAQIETNDDEELSQSDPETSTEKCEEQIRSSKLVNQASKVNRDKREVVKVDGKYSCDQCDSQFTLQGTLNRHIRSKHEGVEYSCDDCVYQSSRLDNLKKHIESKHQGVKYACDWCYYLATQKGDLKKHIKSQHVGVKYT